MQSAVQRKQERSKQPNWMPCRESADFEVTGFSWNRKPSVTSAAPLSSRRSLGFPLNIYRTLWQQTDEEQSRRRFNISLRGISVWLNGRTRRHGLAVKGSRVRPDLSAACKSWSSSKPQSCSKMSPGAELSLCRAKIQSMEETA